MKSIFHTMLLIVALPVIGAAQPVLDLSVDVLEVDGGYQPGGSVWLGNDGTEPLQWSATVDVPWLTFPGQEYSEGVIPPPEIAIVHDEIRIDVDRSIMPTVDAVGHITILTNAGTFSVSVNFTATRYTHGGVLGVYSDAAGLNCSIADESGQIIEFYVVHTQLAETAAIQFSAPQPACMTGAVWVGDLKAFPVTLGDSQTGVSVGYPSCQAPPVHVLTIRYIGAGSSAQCCEYPVRPHPDSDTGTMQTIDCMGYLFDNVTSNVGKVSPGGMCACATVPTATSTWGGVKALYQSE